jgi:hypothetical protein
MCFASFSAATGGGGGGGGFRTQVQLPKTAWITTQGHPFHFLLLKGGRGVKKLSVQKYLSNTHIKAPEKCETIILYNFVIFL